MGSRPRLTRRFAPPFAEDEAGVQERSLTGSSCTPTTGGAAPGAEQPGIDLSKVVEIDREIVMILEPTGEVVLLDWWRELAHEHEDCCSRCPYSSWIEADPASA